jgi:hypothetical protein
MNNANRNEVRATVYNAKLCTFDGSDYWIGALKQGHRTLDVGPENSDPNDGTKEAAIAWVIAEAKRRGFAISESDVEDTTSEAAKDLR